MAIYHAPGQQGSPSPLRAAVRRLGFDSNPMRRASDRLECLALLATVLLALLAVPVAAAVGSQRNGPPRKPQLPSERTPRR